MKKKGFTLVEVMIATLLVGMAIVSIMAANTAFTQANGAGADISTAEFLVEQVRELTAMLPVIDPDTETQTFGAEEGDISHIADYDDVDDFDGKTFSPPIDSRRQVLTNLGDYTQQITVENINAGDFSQTVSDHSSDFVRITVTISLDSREISSASWIRANHD